MRCDICKKECSDLWYEGVKEDSNIVCCPNCTCKILFENNIQKDQHIAELEGKLALTEKALKLAREYMFNVMCAEDVPTEHWFIYCAENNIDPS